MKLELNQSELMLIKEALKEYKSSDGLTVRVDSVHKATESGLKAAMNLFY